MIEGGGDNGENEDKDGEEAKCTIQLQPREKIYLDHFGNGGVIKF